MYNTIKLYETEYPYMLYLWSENLDPQEEWEIWCYVCVTYGLVSSGNVTTAALRRIATIFKDRYPLAYVTLLSHTYMDDISEGANSHEEAKEILRQIESVIPNAGFKLKVSCMTGEQPTEKASPDGIYTSFCGYKWACLPDLMRIGFCEVNFNVKRRGAKPANIEPVDTVPKVEKLIDATSLTRRKILGKVMELFDVIGIVEPIKAKLKIDMKLLLDYDYDVVLPEDLQVLWKENIVLIHQAKDIDFPRSFIPAGVKSKDIHLVATCDAATSMCGTAIYAVVRQDDGKFIANLVTARSKSCSMTIPRNELDSIVLASETLFCVLKTLGDRAGDYHILTDSSIALAWVKNDHKPLKQYVFNRVLHIRRLVNIDKLFHIAGEENPSDILTRSSKIDLEDLGLHGKWQQGPEWLRSPIHDWPIKSYEEICVTDNDSYEKEFVHVPSLNHVDLSWNFSEDCCQTSSSAESCHCSYNQNCCYCLTSTFTKSCNMVLDRSQAPTISFTDLSQSLVISQIFSYTRIGMSVEEINGQFPEEFYIIQDVFSEKSSERLFYNLTKGKEPMFPVDFVRFGFSKSMRIIAYCVRFFTRARHLGHQRRVEYSSNCHLCRLQSRPGNLPKCFESLQVSNPLGVKGCVTSQYDMYIAWRLVCKQATVEVKLRSSTIQLEGYELGEDGILYSGGRLSHPTSISKENPLSTTFNFVKPVAMVESSLVYSLVMHLHWQEMHPGVERLVFMTLQILHVPNLRKLVKYIRKTCLRCKYLLKKTLRVEVGNQNKLALKVAPVFSACQMDIAYSAGFTAYEVRVRATKPVYLLILVCMATSAVSVEPMGDMTTESIILALEAHSSRYGWMKYLFPDLQSSFTKLNDLRISYKDLKGCLHKDKQVVLEFSSPIHHSEHGKVESRVRLVKDLLEKSGEKGFRHSFLEWSTICKRISSTLNSLPIARSEDTRNPMDFDVFGLITPNSFIQGYNRDRAIEGSCCLVGTKTQMLDIVNETREFLEAELLAHIHRFIPSSQSRKNDSLPEIGSVVIFVMKDNARSRNIVWKYGRIIATRVDGRAGKIRIVYRNHNESMFRELDRHLSDVCLISSIDDIAFNTEEHRLAMKIQGGYSD
jgi:hypothetical protein